MKFYKVKINIDALSDIQQATDWYNKRLPELGTRFQKNVKRQINTLKHSAVNYSIRYNNVRCMLIKRFPFLVHFIIDEANLVVEVFAIFHTSRNPQIWEQRTKKS